MHSNEKELALMAAKAADDKKAKNILLMDMRGVTIITDYFVICSGQSGVQVQAIADNIEEKMAEIGLRVGHLEGYREAKWVLMDYGMFVVHIFQEEDREFFDLERLWRDAPIYYYEENMTTMP
jgi:ribosome-associated protein